VAVGLTALALLPTITSAFNNSNEVPFKLYRGYVIVVRGSIGGLKNLNVLVDTGAVPSVVDLRIARKLHLRGQTGRVDVPTKTLTTERVIVSDVQLGPSHAKALPMIVQDLSFAEEALGIRVDAMIGFDLLGQSPFTIDYDSKKLTFGPVDPSFLTVAYAPGLPYAIVILQIQQERLEILVDTGASNLVLFQSGVRNCRRAINIVGRETWSSMGGEIPVAKAQLTAAYLGNVSWGQRVAYIPDNSDTQPSGLAGLLGTLALGQRVAFDPVRNVVAWEPRER
jgi:hypothetical protein